MACVALRKRNGSTTIRYMPGNGAPQRLVAWYLCAGIVFSENRKQKFILVLSSVPILCGFCGDSCW